MLRLSGKIVAHQHVREERGPGAIVKLADSSSDRFADHSRSAFLMLPEEKVHEGYPIYLTLKRHEQLVQNLPRDTPIVILENDFEYLRAGDVVRISVEDGRVRTLYRRESNQNHFLVTERCDNYCLMCSQPPKKQNDDWVIDEILEALPLIDTSAKELGFTGGEPTLLGQRFLEVLSACKAHLPTTGIHVLSNGRKFSDYTFAEAWANVAHPDLMVGIPIYADVSTVHDYVVQADGAFDETVRGVLNLKRLRQRVEIRVVLHQQTIPRLPQLAEFIVRNLLFVDHVALMGLEIMGFTRANLNSLWIEPTDYQRELLEAVEILDAGGLRVSVYNLPLCLLDRRLWPFAMQSISDWKNEFLPQCDECDVKAQCAGFFWSAQFKRSNNVHPIKNAPVPDSRA